MDEVNNAPSSCCGGADCGCGDTKKRKPRWKLLVFAIIMLAAAGVGTYSLIAKQQPAAVPCSEQGCGAGGSCCPSTAK